MRPAYPIRLADPERDAEAVAAIYGHAVEASVATFEERPPSVDEMAERVRRTLLRTPWLVADATDSSRVVGYAYAGPHHERAGYRWSVNVSAYVDVAYQGQGVGRALYERLFVILTRQRFVNAYAGIALPNPASVALHESFGMRRIAVYPAIGYKHGRWHDVAWYGMRITQPSQPPADPVPLPALAD